MNLISLSRLEEALKQHFKQNFKNNWSVIQAKTCIATTHKNYYIQHPYTTTFKLLYSVLGF